MSTDTASTLGSSPTSAHYPHSKILHPEILKFLSVLRLRRGFDAEAYIEAKVSLLNDYLRQSGLKSIVVGVSGGVDSALVLGLVARASRQRNSPIKRYVAALLPYFIDAGTTNQADATARGREVAAAFDAEAVVVDLSSTHNVLKSVADQALGISGDAWASGQLVSYLRTPAFFYLTSLLSQTGLPSVFVGTTNRDEGGFIGYFGKAADAMVDLQLISDLHKSEVYAASRLLQVPQSVLDAIPTGDIYDGRDDESLIGAPYDFIELYSLYLTLCDSSERDRAVMLLGAEARAQWDYYAARVCKLNAENTHKYLGGSPAVHLDVYARAVPGGWRVENLSASTATKAIDSSGFVNQFEIAAPVIEALAEVGQVKLETLDGFGPSAALLHDLMSGAECEALLTELARQKWTPVGRNGMLKDFDPAHDLIGSYRASYYSEVFAERLWRRIAASDFPLVRMMDEFTPTDADGSSVWRAVGVGPLMRFIRYTQDGLLVPHYDAPYVYDDNRRTLMSLVLYLTDGGPGADGVETGGATRFILDTQRHLPLAQRDLSDWDGEASARDVLLPISPKLGAALVFDHRVLHDSEKFVGPTNKIIMRTDIIFERCGLPPRRGLTVSRPLGMPEVDVPGQSLLTSMTTGSAEIADSAVIVASADKRAVLLAKALRDPFYGSAYAQLGSLEAMEEAGFFDDGAPQPVADPLTGMIPVAESLRADLNWLTTPTDKIVRNLAALESSGTAALNGKKWLAVLITTGAFCPVHDGHVQMMELAREAVEAEDGIVLGGYLSPSHDGYVSLKCGQAALKAPHRLRLCEEALRQSDWLMADGWESMAVDHDLNFTEVVSRLERYLAQHIRTHLPVHVVYVFGGDNAKFSRAFLGRGRSICVPRAGSEAAFQHYANLPEVLANKRLMFGKRTGRNISSTLVRAGDDSLMSEAGRMIYRRWRLGKPESSARALYYLRDESAWAYAPWYGSGKTRRSRSVLAFAWQRFVRSLTTLIEDLHKQAPAPDMSLQANCKVVNLRCQRRKKSRLTTGERVISLDPCLGGDYNLAVSRRFAVSTGRSRPRIDHRPGFPCLDVQLAKIEPGKYVLFDDDIATGYTIGQIKELLPSSVQITRVVALTDRRSVKISGEPVDVLDILDCRDFLAGTREGGLVVELADGSLGRAPYTLPYISPADRVSTPLSSEVELSLAVWRLNETFFRSVSNSCHPILLGECNDAFQNLMGYIGFAPTAEMTTICRWHVEHLEQAHGLRRAG